MNYCIFFILIIWINFRTYFNLVPSSKWAKSLFLNFVFFFRMEPNSGSEINVSFDLPVTKSRCHRSLFLVLFLWIVKKTKIKNKFIIWFIVKGWSNERNTGHLCTIQHEKLPYLISNWLCKLTSAFNIYFRIESYLFLSLVVLSVPQRKSNVKLRNKKIKAGT